MALSDLFSRRRKEHAESEVGASDAPVHPTKVLARFIAGLSSRSQPVLLDLGPVVGTNVSFFGEQLGCKIIVEDLSKDIGRQAKVRYMMTGGTKTADRVEVSTHPATPAAKSPRAVISAA